MPVRRLEGTLAFEGRTRVAALISPDDPDWQAEEVEMRRTGILAALLFSIGLAVMFTTTHVTARSDGQGREPREVVLRDDCDPTDPGWAPTGGCNRSEGDVTLAEFGAARLSPLAPSVIGHPAWFFDPSYLEVKPGKQIKILNEGGRTHTFTEVVNFGGGRVPGLNTSQPGVPSLTPASECVAPGVVDIPGGGSSAIEGLSAGDHKFQCCIHPWMRTQIAVSDKEQ
jgi:plastocyanin